MKSKLSSIIFAIPFVLIYLNSYSQTKAVDFSPKYVTVTTLHGASGINFEAWKALETEYFNKVTNKIDLILSHEVLISYFSKGLRDIKVINVFNSWDDIQHVNAIREELIKKAWPNEEERKLFFEKQNGFYTNFHSDEIFLTSNMSKPLELKDKKPSDKPLVYYVDTNILSDNDSKKSFEYYNEYVEEVIFKNKYIEAYLPYRHYWGDDSREFVEVFVVKSLTELEKALEKNKKLLEIHIPDKVKRDKFLGTFGEAVAGHKDEIYVNVPSLSKK